jgi:hypothetical protein
MKPPTISLLLKVTFVEGDEGFFFFLFQSWFFGFFGVFVAQAPVFYGMPFESLATNNYNNCWQYI